ncbi:MAG: hypothetical protein EA338_10390 [Roseinatronobacter sp.]|nr:MAG: hypothetical protein EA338_10390 [Roseinatronobacter sp.]
MWADNGSTALTLARMHTPNADVARAISGEAPVLYTQEHVIDARTAPKVRARIFAQSAETAPKTQAEARIGTINTGG